MGYVNGGWTKSWVYWKKMFLRRRTTNQNVIICHAHTKNDQLSSLPPLLLLLLTDDDFTKKLIYWQPWNLNAVFGCYVLLKLTNLTITWTLIYLLYYYYCICMFYKSACFWCPLGFLKLGIFYNIACHRTRENLCAKRLISWSVAQDVFSIWVWKIGFFFK